MTESNARNDEAKSESRNRFGKKKIVELGLLLVILAVAAFTLAQKDFKRFGQLFHDGAVAAQQWDEERTKFKQSQAAFKEIEAGISSEKASLEGIEQEIKEAEAQLKSARADLYKNDIQRYRLTSMKAQRDLYQAELDAGFRAIVLPRTIQGFGLGLFFVPLSAATFSGIPAEKTGNASGIFNLVRNLGGSFGVAFSATILARRTQLHQSFLAEHVTPYNPGFQSYFDQIQQWLQIHQPQFSGSSAALGEIYHRVMRQAHMLAFNDTFWLLAIITAALVPLTIFFRQKSAAVLSESVY